MCQGQIQKSFEVKGCCTMSNEQVEAKVICLQKISYFSMQSTWVVKMAAKKSSLHWLPLEMLRSQTEIVQNMMEASGMTQRIKHLETCRGSFCQSTNCIKLVCSCAIQVQNRVPTSAFSSGYVVCAARNWEAFSGNA